MSPSARDGPCPPAVDFHQAAAAAADALATVVIERDHLFAALGQAVIDKVEHLQKRHIGANAGRRVFDHPVIAVRAAPSVARREA